MTVKNDLYIDKNLLTKHIFKISLVRLSFGNNVLI